MVNFAVPVLALAMIVSVTAAPAPTTSGTLFSFSSWVEDIIANPDTALSPEEAVLEAAKAGVVRSAGGLQKRVSCTASFKDAYVRIQFQTSDLSQLDFVCGRGRTLIITRVPTPQNASMILPGRASTRTSNAPSQIPGRIFRCAALAMRRLSRAEVSREL